MNLVFSRKNSKTPLTNSQLAEAADGVGITEKDYPERVSGSLCFCEGSGEFVLMRAELGQKRYMKCRICGGRSHL